jgi:prolyl oligopeptidase
MKLGTVTAFVVSFGALLACAPQASEPPTLVPVAATSTKPSTSATPSAAPHPQRDLVKTRIDDVVDDYFGDKIADPYRWLEDNDSKEVEAWTVAENARTRGILDGDPRRNKLHARIDELLSIGFVSAPTLRTVTTKGKKHTRYFFTKREGKQDQAVLLVRDAADGADRVLIDPLTLGGEDKTTAIDWWFVSEDGGKVAYGISASGDEMSTLHVRDVESGTDLSDAIPRTRATWIAWHPDNKRFFYVRLPEAGSVPKDEEPYHRKVFEHVMGKPWKDDALVFDPESVPNGKMTDWPGPSISPNGRWLVVYVGHGPAKSSLWLKDLKKKDAKWIALVDGVDALYNALPHVRASKDVIYVRTNEGAPNFRIFEIDPNAPDRAKWKELIAETTSPLRDFEVVGDNLFLGYLDAACSRIERVDLDGAHRASIELPEHSSASVPRGQWDGDEAVFEEQSFVAPPRLMRIAGIQEMLAPKKVELKGLPTKKPKTLATTTFSTIEQSLVDLSQYEVEQIHSKSKDGTQVSAFVLQKKGTPRDGTAPTILYGYGGFNLVQTPVFNRTVFAFLERGGIWVLSNLRGGAEYGEAWHRGGMLENKQHTFDDQIAVAEEIVARKITSPSKLAIQGGSNGGLLVAALETQRPDLFHAVVCQVPLTDMLRYQKFLLAKLWVPEYGSSDDAAQYKYLAAYSPYHHVADGVAYPATMVLTGVSDSRVHPLHARKFAARLQASTSSDRPILLRVEDKAGHGAGKPRSKQVEELTDIYVFLFSQLGL